MYQRIHIINWSSNLQRGKKFWGKFQCYVFNHIKTFSEVWKKNNNKILFSLFLFGFNKEIKVTFSIAYRYLESFIKLIFTLGFVLKWRHIDHLPCVTLCQRSPEQRHILTLQLFKIYVWKNRWAGLIVFQNNVFCLFFSLGSVCQFIRVTSDCWLCTKYFSSAVKKSFDSFS